MKLEVEFFTNGSLKIKDYKSLWNNRELWCSTLDINLVKKILGNNINTIIEFGSYDGGDGIKYKYYFPDANVYSIEPSPNCYNKLKTLQTYGLNTFNLAISNKDSIIDFYETYDVSKDNYAPCGSINKHLISDGEAHNRPPLQIKDAIKVECKTLNTFCYENKINNIDLLHIDVEGHSLEVLQGLGELTPNIIFIEVYGPKYDHSNIIKTLLENKNYIQIKKQGCDELYVHQLIYK